MNCILEAEAAEAAQESIDFNNALRHESNQTMARGRLIITIHSVSLTCISRNRSSKLSTNFYLMSFLKANMGMVITK